VFPVGSQLLGSQVSNARPGAPISESPVRLLMMKG
jgi:hypothetical protein